MQDVRETAEGGGLEALAEEPVASDDGDPLCPHCLEPIERFDHFCRQCGAPITSHAVIDPLGQVFAAGHIYRNATSSRPPRIVFLGMWLIFGLPFVLMAWGCVAWAVDRLRGRSMTRSRQESEFLGEDGAVWVIPSKAVQTLPIGVVEILAWLGLLGMTVLHGWVLWKLIRWFFRRDASGDAEGAAEEADADAHPQASHEEP